MQIIQVTALLYAVVAILTLTIFLGHLCAHFNDDVFERSRSAVAKNMVLLAALWPLTLLVHPSLLRNPQSLYSKPKPPMVIPKFSLDSWIPNDPQRCSSSVSYSQRFARGGDTCGVLSFRASDLMPLLNRRLCEHENLRGGEDGWLYDWFSARDDGDAREVPVPEPPSRFRFLAAEALDAGLGEIFCKECDEVVPIDMVRPEVDTPGRPGWTFRHYRCPASHLLLSVEGMHMS